MTYHALGSGPGESRTYFVDLPDVYVPGVVDIGPNTEITLPMEALVGDSLAYARRHIPQLTADFLGYARPYLPQLAEEAVVAAWPTFSSLAEQEMPGLLETAALPLVRKEEARIIKHLYLAAALMVAGVGAVVWWRTRR